MQVGASTISVLTLSSGEARRDGRGDVSKRRTVSPDGVRSKTRTTGKRRRSRHPGTLDWVTRGLPLIYHIVGGDGGEGGGERVGCRGSLFFIQVDLG